MLDVDTTCKLVVHCKYPNFTTPIAYFTYIANHEIFISLSELPSHIHSILLFIYGAILRTAYNSGCMAYTMGEILAKRND